MVLSSSSVTRPTRRLGAQSSLICLCFLAFGCEVDSEPAVATAGLEKIPPRLQIDLGAGLTRALLVELDEKVLVENGSGGESAARLGELTGALASDLGELPPSKAAETVDARAAVYEAAQERILDAVDSNEVELLTQYTNLPLLYLRVNSLSAAMSLANRPEVLRLHEEQFFEHELTESLALIKQPQAAAGGKVGAGTSVAVLDTGADYGNAAFGSCTTTGGDCKVAYAADFAVNDNSRDDNGHGTNVSAIVLGVAPGAKIVALDVFADATAPSSVILQAIDWVVSNRATYNIVAMNLSLGGGLYSTACTSDVFANAIANARTAGVLAAIASGNNGSSTAIASPACTPAAISVGAVYDTALSSTRTYPSINCSDSNITADKITCFSNSSNSLSMLAPGAPITAAGITMSGTSQAAPHVAGALAVLRAAFPNETVNQIATRVTSNGLIINDPRNDVARRRLDLSAALGGSGVVADTTPPTGSVSINAAASSTRTTAVTLTIEASDKSGVPAMCVSNNAAACTAFQTFTTTRTWTLSSGDGMKTVYVTLRDAAGNVTVVSDAILLDSTLPIGATLSGTPGDRQVCLRWTAASDAGSGVASYKIVTAPNTAPSTCTAGTQVYQGASTAYVHTGLTNGAVYGYRVCPVDGAGNVGTGSAITVRAKPESVGPTGSVVINGGAMLVNNATVTLTVSAMDASGVGTMCISNTTTCSAWIPYATTKTWTLGTANGTATVRVFFRDVYDNPGANSATARTTVDSKLPTMGTTFNATVTGGQVALSWNAASDASGIASYTVVWQSGATAPASCRVGNVAFSGNALSFNHAGRSAGTYGYRVCAVDAAGNIAAGLTRTVTVR